jgi:hypothetical protein
MSDQNFISNAQNVNLNSSSPFDLSRPAHPIRPRNSEDATASLFTHVIIDQSATKTPVACGRPLTFGHERAMAPSDLADKKFETTAC